MRKAFLLGGIALFVAAGSWAGQRTRGSEAMGSGHAGDVPVIQEIAPGKAMAVVNGSKLIARADGYVSLDEIIQEYGSPERYTGEMILSSVPRVQAADGTALFANGAVGFYADLSPTAMPQEQTIESRKQNVAWMEQDVNGELLTVFADGYITFGMDERNPGLLGRAGIPSAQSGSEKIWADGMIHNN